MKLKIEPSKLKEMLTTGLISNQLSNTTAIITPTAISFQDLSLSTMGVYAVYTKDYFPKDGFENQNEQITFTKYLLDALVKGFKNDEQIEMYTEGNKLFVVGARDKFEDIIPEVAKSDFPVKMKSESYGIIPEKINTEKTILAKFSVDELHPITADRYQFISDGKNLSLRTEFTDTSAYTKTLKPLLTVNMPQMIATFQGEYYDAIVKSLTGEVWIALEPDSITVMKREKTYSITLMLAGIA